MSHLALLDTKFEFVRVRVKFYWGFFVFMNDNLLDGVQWVEFKDWMQVKFTGIPFSLASMELHLYCLFCSENTWVTTKDEK